MTGEAYEAYNPQAVMKFEIGARLKDSLSKTNMILNYMMEIQPSNFDDYRTAFLSRIENVVESDEVNFQLNNVIDNYKDMNLLIEDPKLVALVVNFFLFQLEIESDFSSLTEEIEVSSFNNTRELERLSYYLAKTCEDVWGRKKGISLWKQVVSLRLRDERAEYERKEAERMKSGDNEISMIEMSDRAVKRWIQTGIADFARVLLDEHKVLYRFDRCLTPEVLKELNDPEWAYLCSCYIGDAPDFNFGNHYLRRTQTLHAAPFCDELYWDPRVHDNPEQPSLEFTKNLGKEDYP